VEETGTRDRPLLSAALERIPPQLEAPSEPRESPETATKGEAAQRRPRRRSGGCTEAVVEEGVRRLIPTQIIAGSL
jgi:hypothetical protein